MTAGLVVGAAGAIGAASVAALAGSVEHMVLADRDASAARVAFMRDLDAVSLIELDAATCEAAATIAELTGVRTLDALHLAAARRAGGAAVPFLTFDVRQAQAARALGFTVIGA